jgi:hypothetical protein
MVAKRTHSRPDAFGVASSATGGQRHGFAFDLLRVSVPPW